MIVAWQTIKGNRLQRNYMYSWRIFISASLLHVRNCSPMPDCPFSRWRFIFSLKSSLPSRFTTNHSASKASHRYISSDNSLSFRTLSTLSFSSLSISFIFSFSFLAFSSASFFFFSSSYAFISLQ